MQTTSCQRNRTAEQAQYFPNQMIEQINIALEQKGPGILPSAWVVQACRRD